MDGHSVHGGILALAAAGSRGVERMFTLSGAHVFPLYDAAAKGQPGMPIIDVRHEATAVFAAEATAKLTRRPGLAVLTAGPGVTNAVSAITTAHFNGSQLLVIAGRAPQSRWGQGSLQELDHPPLVASVTKLAATVQSTSQIGAQVAAGLDLAGSPHRGPVFLDIALDHLYDSAQATPLPPPVTDKPGMGDLAAAVAALRAAHRPVLVIGGDVWAGGAESAARRAAESLGLPTVTNGMGRGVLPGDSPVLVTRARSRAFGEADLVVVAGTPLDFRLGFGLFGGRDGAPPAAVVHLADAQSALATHIDLAAGVVGDFTTIFEELTAAALAGGGLAIDEGWLGDLREAARAVATAEEDLLGATALPIHPARIYGELKRVLDSDAVIIGDGGDFVSFAGRLLEPASPGCWLDPGPYGCLGTGLGYAIAARLARPSAQVVLLLGDGAAGFSLMDVDTLVRHRLPVVIICGNNGVWGLERGPMRLLYGYDVAAELAPEIRYDEVVRALGGAGELVRQPSELAAALRRAFASGVPYLVNVITDPDAAYPRSTTGI